MVKTSCLVLVVFESLQTFINFTSSIKFCWHVLTHRTWIYRLHYRNQKLRTDIQSQKTTFLLITLEISLNIQVEKCVLRSHFKTTIRAFFPSNKLSYMVINLYLQKLSTLTITKFNTFTRTDITLQTNVKNLGVNPMCSAFTPDCRYDNNSFKFIGTVHCPNEISSRKLCLHKKAFNLSAEATINALKVRTRVRCAKYFLRNKEYRFS